MLKTVKPDERLFAVCIRDEEYPASLEVRKIYQVIPDESAARHQLLRVIDESGEDYLYPESCFERIELPNTLKEALFLTA